jgi:Cdc6-like AAA superfamily ATPase
MDNPYVFRGPVHEPDMFFGRIHELNEIAAFLRGNQSISVVGPRKIGKTSLMFHLMRQEVWPELGLGEDILFVYLDCEVLGEGGHEEILSQFAGEIGVALDSRDLPPEPALERAIDKPSRLSFEGAIRRLNRRGLRVVLILDEFERLSTNSPGRQFLQCPAICCRALQTCLCHRFSSSTDSAYVFWQVARDLVQPVL